MTGKKVRACLVSGAVICFFGLSACSDGSSPSFSLEKKFDLDGDGVIPFFEPGGVAVDHGGNIYVADSGNQRIVKFDSGGRFIKSLGSKGRGPGEFLCPWQVVIHDREMIVYDWRRNIQRFTLEGDYISGFAH